jgi:SAM-dependent methyltransferase
MRDAMAEESSLGELLKIFWLRPETALWREIDIRAMASFNFSSPSLDLGCGDGMFSFIRAGGRLSPDADAFGAVTDIERFFDNADVFDAFDDSWSPAVTRKPDYLIDVGFDHKNNLLRKAARLDLYKTLELGDANEPIPFPTATFASIFSNIVYWLRSPEAVLGEITRLLQPGGRACLMLPNSTLPDFSFYQQLYARTGDERWSFLARLDRGRFEDNIKTARSAAAWETMFAKAQLRVVEHVQHLSKPIVQIWDIGLRPLFPVLLRMAKAVPPGQLRAIKTEWINILRPLVEPLVELDPALRRLHEPGFHCYIVTK